MPLKLGSQGELTGAWQREMRARFASYAKGADGLPLRVDFYFGLDDQAVQQEYERRTFQPVDGVVSDGDLLALGILKPPPPRHACLTFRGTGGIVGQDPTSRVAQMCSSVVEEVPILYPASMGGIPVGAATDVGAPSGRRCVEIAVDMAVKWVQSTRRTFVIGGYSLGAEAASRLRAELLPGGRLEPHTDRYVGGYVFGNPARRYGPQFFLGPTPAGFGIADWHLPEDALRWPDGSIRWDWCELVDTADMYGNTPGGDVGDVIRAVYGIVMDTQVSDPGGTLLKVIRHLLKLLDEAGVDLPFNPGGMVTGALAGLLISLLPSLPIPTIGNKETASAVQAAILALRFFAGPPPTAAHISYEHRHAIPGMTHLDLAAQHVRHWAGQKAVRT